MAGIFHAYYLAALAPPLAALAGIGCFELWRRGSGHLALGLATLAAQVGSKHYHPLFYWAVVVATTGAATCAAPSPGGARH